MTANFHHSHCKIIIQLSSGLCAIYFTWSTLAQFLDKSIILCWVLRNYLYILNLFLEILHFRKSKQFLFLFLLKNYYSLNIYYFDLVIDKDTSSWMLDKLFFIICIYYYGSVMISFLFIPFFDKIYIISLVNPFNPNGELGSIYLVINIFYFNALDLLDWEWFTNLSILHFNKD